MGASYGRTAKMVSLSARRAWIEIVKWQQGEVSYGKVALRKESVDRNISLAGLIRIDTVALRKESVDRNIMLLIILLCGLRSLSARRAWIEIRVSILTMLYTVVALRKESVDRNHSIGNIPLHIVGSLSARRAWIEISRVHCNPHRLSSRSPQGERG